MRPCSAVAVSRRLLSQRLRSFRHFTAGLNRGVAEVLCGVSEAQMLLNAVRRAPHGHALEPAEPEVAPQLLTISLLHGLRRTEVDQTRKTGLRKGQPHDASGLMARWRCSHSRSASFIERTSKRFHTSSRSRWPPPKNAIDSAWVRTEECANLSRAPAAFCRQ